MNSMPLYLKSIWACSILGQLIVLVLLLLKGNFRRVPLFTAYTTLNICQAGFILLLYVIPGISSATFLTLAWASEFVTLVAQALATTEILRITLKPYPGIWGLGWRALASTSVLVVIVVALISRGHTAEERLFELNRGYHLTFATAVIVCLLLVRYYSIRVPTAYKMILGGFCLNSCVEVLIYTFIQAFLSQGLRCPPGELGISDYDVVCSCLGHLGGGCEDALSGRGSASCLALGFRKSTTLSRNR